MSLRSIEEHLAAILATVHPTPVVEVPLADALGHTLAEPVRSRVDLPGFTNSAMDGYAVRASDCSGASEETPLELPVDGDIAAGETRELVLIPGRCWRIMTGAPLPAGPMWKTLAPTTSSRSRQSAKTPSSPPTMKTPFRSRICWLEPLMVASR